MSKQTYRIRNWSQYNQALMARGSVTLWLDEQTLQSWQGEKRQGERGRPPKYSDMAIVCGLTLKALFKLTFRMTEGFIKSWFKALQLEVGVPNYTLLCKRQKTVLVDLPKVRGGSKEPLQVVIDSSGLKVFGEGEWKVRQHGWKKHRLWRKLHVGVNVQTHGVEALLLTDLGIQDSEGFVQLLGQVDAPISKAIGDGAYDSFSCYEASHRRGCELIAPPQHNAKTSAERVRNKKKASEAAVKKRDEAVLGVRQLGRKGWKQAVGYHQRSLAETAIFRLKTLFGSALKARTRQHQETEAAIWCRALNTLTGLGMPETVKI